MLKKASLEDSGVSDPKTGKKIRISTTIRLMYRIADPDIYGAMRNARLNVKVAEDFAGHSSNVKHYFRLGKKDTSRTEHKPAGAEEGQVYANVAEIRGIEGTYFISAVKESTIDVLTIQDTWMEPRYKGSQDDPIALGDS
jgi:hypothetical protein